MGKKLVICEKPSVAREIAQAVGAAKQGEAWESGEYVVFPLHGHVCDLVAPDKYEGRGWDKWKLDLLPMVPGDYRLAPTDDECVAAAARLVARPDVDVVVHACDPDREGEGIARRLLTYLGCDKPVMRLWCNSLETDAIRRGLGEMREDSAYDGLGDAAWGRAVADWLVGMNLTRACSVHCKWHKPVLHAGRVVTPTLRLIADRTRAHDGHKAVPFFEVCVNCEGIGLKSDRMADKAAAEGAAAAMAGEKVEVTSAQSRERKASAPTLYDLTSAQRDASRVFGMSASRALDVLQALYEAKLTTYPRTDSKYITSDDADDAARLLATPGVAAVAGCATMPGADVSALVNDDKVSGHTALLPTSAMSEKEISGLPEDQRRMARLVCTRLFCAVSPDGLDRVGKVEATCAGTRLTASVTERVEAGWRAVWEASVGKQKPKDGEAEAEGRLPASMTEGALLDHGDAEVREGKTKPPALYTDASLLSAMEHADKLVGDKRLARALRDSDSHAGGIGTPATRAATIEKIVSWGYAERAGKQIRATELGLAADAAAPDALATPALTAEWETRLSEVEAGTASVEGFIRDVESSLPALVDDAVSKPVRLQGGGSVLGRCPKCGKGNIVEAKSGRICFCDTRRGHMDKETGEFVVDEEGCGLRISTSVFGKRLTHKQLADLVAGKKVPLRGVKTAKGTPVKSVSLDLDDKWGTRCEFGQVPGAAGKRRG